MSTWSGLRGAQIASKTLLLSISVRVFTGEISIWASRLNEEALPSPVWAGIICPLRAQTEQKCKERVNSFSLLELTFFLSCPQTLKVLVIQSGPTLWPHGLCFTRLLCPLVQFSKQETGVICHALLHIGAPGFLTAELTDLQHSFS